MRVPTIPRADKTGLLSLNCINNVVYAEQLFSFWESGIILKRGCWFLAIRPTKNHEQQVFNGLPW